ncbi:hypothetical protein BKA83DRAFT_104189 [Pisolithus microcarpus]|nr:hypothetical protein BKA83DRAFT_104189 [Pisolithus microcarpus]
MDNAGWHAQRRADKDSFRYFSRRHRGSDGQYVPEVVVGPLPNGQISTALPEYTPRPSNISSSATHSKRLAEMPPAERAMAQRIPQMSPLLQFMVGPLLRYDTIDMNGVWHGAALILPLYCVAADAGSNYDPVPVLTYQWDPEEPGRVPNSPTSSTFSKYELSPHPGGPSCDATSSLGGRCERLARMKKGGPKACTGTIDQTQRVVGQEIYVYSGRGGGLCIKYSINGGIQLSFYVPALRQNMRWATHSGPDSRVGTDPMWVDLLQKHSQEPFHVLVGGGDQLYCDSITREPEMQDWVHAQNGPSKLACPLTPEIAECIDRFYFNHYCTSFRHGAFARANSSIPMLNMCANQWWRLEIDGFGSYPDELQSSPIFQAIGARGYYFYLLFQCFINPYIDGLDDRPGHHPFKSLILGIQGPFVGLPSHSFLAPLGPNVHILMLDCRAERKKDRVCSDAQYRKVHDHIKQLPSSVEHLIVQIGIPIAYPRLVFLETALDSKLNPLIALGRNRFLGLGGLVNKFNAEAELLDDLNDHWTAKTHKKERNFFIQELQGIAKMKRLRITFLSGDVHCAAVGVFKTYTGGRGSVEVSPSGDFRYMINIVTSAIVNTPPPAAVIAMVSTLATKCALKNKYIMGRRNWCAVQWDSRTGEVIFDLRGTSVGYEVRVPPPQWAPGP